MATLKQRLKLHANKLREEIELKITNYVSSSLT